MNARRYVHDVRFRLMRRWPLATLMAFTLWQTGCSCKWDHDGCCYMAIRLPLARPTVCPACRSCSDTAPAITCHCCGQHMGRWSESADKDDPFGNEPTPAQREPTAATKEQDSTPSQVEDLPPEEGHDDLLPMDDDPLSGTTAKSADLAKSQSPGPTKKKDKNEATATSDPLFLTELPPDLPAVVLEDPSFIRPPDDDRELQLNELLELPAERVAELPEATSTKLPPPRPASLPEASD